MKRISVITLMLVSGIAWAADEGAEAEKPPVEKTPAFGQASMDWLKLQRSGAAGSENMQAATPVVQEKAVKRFIDTYNHKIPEFYDRNAFVKGGD